MDFTNYDAIFSDSNESRLETPVVNELKKSDHEIENEINMEERMNLAKSNKDLIEMCIATKSDHFLSRTELFNYGVLALNTAAMEADNLGDFRIFARRRIELTLNKAIAEAYLINEMSGMVCDNDKLSMEFDSIEKTYCYN